MSFTIEKILHVYDSQREVYLEIRANPFGMEITTANDKANEDCFGKVHLNLLSKEQAKALANAILEMSEFIK